LVKHLINCEIDLAILSLPIRDERLEIMELHQEELWLALPPGHALECKRQVNATDLGNEPLIVLNEEHCLGDQVLGFCDQHDLSTQIRFRSAQLETIQALVCAGLGISLIPAMAIHANRPHAPQYRRLAPPRPSRKIAAAWHRQRGLGRASAKFLETMALMFRRPKRQGD
jgi:LysR family hydrogen peroxide-inducible transcriptional activator